MKISFKSVCSIDANVSFLTPPLSVCLTLKEAFCWEGEGWAEQLNGLDCPLHSTDLLRLRSHRKRRKPTNLVRLLLSGGTGVRRSVGPVAGGVRARGAGLLQDLRRRSQGGEEGVRGTGQGGHGIGSTYSRLSIFGTFNFSGQCM